MNIKARGFASMDAKKRREIAREGGKAAHRKGTAHRWTTESAKAAAEKSAATRKTDATKTSEA